MPSSAMLILSGLLCVGFWGWSMRRLIPRPDRPPSPWIATEARAAVVTISLLTVLVLGIGLIARGI